MKEELDIGYGMIRTRSCAPAVGHIWGHVLDDDGPEPTGLRYCINSLSLSREEEKNPTNE